VTRQQVPNVELKSDTARDNLLTNGGFEIWQRGNGPFTTLNAFAADRWMLSFGGGATLSVSRETTNISDNSLVAAVCTVNVGGGFANLQQKVEDFWQLRSGVARGITFSIRVKTTVASAAQAFIQVDGTNTPGTTHTGGGTYQTLTATVPSAGASSLVVGVIFTGSATVYLDNAMLVVGSVAADYAPLHPADDLARCQRYYEVQGGGSGATFVHQVWSGAGGLNIQWTHLFATQKAITPTLTKVGTWSGTNLSGQPTAGDAHVSSYTFAFVSAAAVGACQVYSPNATCFITAEANP